MVAEPPADPIPGEWYLGLPCSYCEEMVLFLPDITRGKGELSLGLMEDKFECLCARGHLTRFRPYELRQFRWWLRCSSRAFST
jgi:hypothetical protein